MKEPATGSNLAGTLGRSAAAVASLAAGGVLIQWLAGPPDITLFAFPANAFLLVCLVLLAALAAVFRRSAFFGRLTGVPLSAALICALALCGIVMGLVPQASHLQIEASPFPDGLHNVTASWPFMLLYVATVFTLMCVMIRRAVNFRWSDYGFFLNHAGLLLLLTAAGFGAADRAVYRMSVHRHIAQDTALDLSTGHHARLPFSVVLDSFDIDHYPAYAAAYRPGDGAGDRYIWADCAVVGKPVAAYDMELTVLEYLPRARHGSGGFYPTDDPGAPAAARVRLRDLITGEQAEDWINSMNNDYAIHITAGQVSAYLLDPEPSRFSSDITLDGGDGKYVHARIEVNKPLRYGHWTLYQYGYDMKEKNYSVIQLVYDPWLGMAYAGIAMIAAGSLAMVWRGRARKRKGGGR